MLMKRMLRTIFFQTALCLCCVFLAWQVQANGISPREFPTSEAFNNAYNQWKTPDMRTSNDKEIWKQGTSPEALLHSRTRKDPPPDAHSNKTGPSKKASRANDAEEEGISIAGGAIEGDATQLGPSWRAPTDKSVVIDEDLKKEKHDVIGAYGEMVKSEDFEMRMGPEVYVPMGGAKFYQGEDKPDTTELGVGMKFKWGF